MNSPSRVPESQIQLFQSPVNGGPMKLAPAHLIEQLNAQIALGALKNRGGETVAKPIEGAYVETESGAGDPVFAFPVMGEIVILIADQAIDITELVNG